MQKSKEKNIAWEENRRRTEASIARKRANPVANGLSSAADGQDLGLPSTSGAMDSLLEKLRAAAPQARDQRDRRRRARLKERHQVRVASGQRMPEVGGTNGVGENQASKETKEGEAQEGAGGGNGGGEQDAAKATNQESAVMSEGDDIADRAASMLQGLRQGSGSDRTKRRESAEEARRNRRLRRRMLASGNNKKDDGSAVEDPPPVPQSPDRDQRNSADSRKSSAATTIATAAADTDQPPETPTITISQEGDEEEQKT